MRLVLFTAVASLLFLGACASNSSDNNAATESEQDVTVQFASSCEGEVFASGTIDREFTDTTWNEPFVPEVDAHVRMRISSAFSDGPSVMHVERDVMFVDIPFDFSVCADAAEIAQTQRGDLFFSVQIFNHAEFQTRVGDLVSETANIFEGPASGLEVLVSGLEHCDADNAGGFCTTRE